MKKFLKNIILCIIVILTSTNIFADKMRVAVLNVKSDGIPQSTASAITNLIIIQLVNSEKFIVVERDKMDKILEEQGFQQTGCTDQECAVEIGKLLSANKILVGEVNKVGDSILLTVRIIDVEKGIAEYAAHDRVIAEEDLDLLVNKVVENLIASMEGKSLTKFKYNIIDILENKAPEGLCISYMKFTPTKPPFKDYYKGLNGGSLEYRKSYNPFVSYQFGVSFVIGDSVGVVNAKTFINSYAVGIRLGMPTWYGLYPYVGGSIITAWCREYNKYKFANFLGYGGDGHFGLGKKIYKDINIFAQYSYILAKIKDDNNTDISGNSVSFGIIYNL